MKRMYVWCERNRLTLQISQKCITHYLYRRNRLMSIKHNYGFSTRCSMIIDLNICFWSVFLYENANVFDWFCFFSFSPHIQASVIRLYQIMLIFKNAHYVDSWWHTPHKYTHSLHHQIQYTHTSTPVSPTNSREPTIPIEKIKL